jgi:hypothetical protein
LSRPSERNFEGIQSFLARRHAAFRPTDCI